MVTRLFGRKQTAPEPHHRGDDATDGVISPQQKAYFDTFGFLAVRGVFAGDADRMIEGFEEVFADEGHPRMETFEELHLDQRRVIIPQFVTKTPKLSWLLDDPRVVGIVSTLLGPGSEYAESDGNLFFCESSWHPDTYGAPLTHRHLKLSFYLDSLHGESGAIRMIPGTSHHRTPFAKKLRADLEDPRRIADIYGVDPRDIPSWTLESEAGDVIAWDFRTIHASFNGGERRRLFSINFRGPQDPA
jgi:ectoine hydroxylase-related dioxygenase (phytanoyl-CoA dioxygenase family)